MPKSEFVCFSELHARGGIERAFAATHVILTIRTEAEEGSEFAGKTVELRKLPQELWLQALLKVGYDGMFLLSDELDVPLGHAFWQRHGGWAGVLQVHTTPIRRKTGVGTSIVRRLIAWGLEQSDLNYIQIGNGGSDELSAILRKIRTEPIDRVRYHPENIGRFEFRRIS